MLHANVDQIRKLAIISLFYDDELLDKFVLKGGNALALVHEVNNRASVDVDVSMEKEFKPDELAEVTVRLRTAFERVFGEEEFSVFDFKLYPTPGKVNPEYASFWGGYTLAFKVIETSRYKMLNENQRRQQAAVIGDDQQKTFTVDISKFEYVESKELADLDGYSIYVYTPVMIVYEKLRAICQQMEAYGQIVRTNRRPRAKDFYDIHSLVSRWKTPEALYSPYNLNILQQIFAIKRVPLHFLEQITNERDFHREDFSSVQASLTQATEAYDYYFDYVLRLLRPFNELWLESADQSAATSES